jgi:DNA modification methylase
MRRPILNHLKRGRLVYDPFLGSGTTLMAAETAERACFGTELEPKYVDVIVTRWEQFTGQKATLEATGHFRGGARCPTRQSEDSAGHLSPLTLRI